MLHPLTKVEHISASRPFNKVVLLPVAHPVASMADPSETICDIIQERKVNIFRNTTYACSSQLAKAEGMMRMFDGITVERDNVAISRFDRVRGDLRIFLSVILTCSKNEQYTILFSLRMLKGKVSRIKLTCSLRNCYP